MREKGSYGIRRVPLVMPADVRALVAPAILRGMRLPALRTFAFLLFTSASMACTSASDGSESIAYDGQPGTVPAVFAQNVLRIMASVNGSPKRAVVVDTGAAITAFDATAYADANFKSGRADSVGLE